MKDQGICKISEYEKDRRFLLWSFSKEMVPEENSGTILCLQFTRVNFRPLTEVFSYFLIFLRSSMHNVQTAAIIAEKKNAVFHPNLSIIAPNRIADIKVPRFIPVFTIPIATAETGIYKCEAFAFPYIKEQAAQILSVTKLQHPALTILEEHDRANHTSLRDSLSVFLRKQCNILETSKEMHVHRNIIKYRIARIQEITGISFEDDQELQYLWLSV